MSFAVLSASADPDDTVTFEASADKVRTWQDAQFSGAARWATHDVFAGKPVKEFIGPGLAQLHLSVRLDINRGVIPRDELRKLRRLRDTGAVLQFTIGSGDMSLVGEFTISDLNETWKNVDRAGVLTTAIVAISMEEYA